MLLDISIMVGSLKLAQKKRTIFYINYIKKYFLYILYKWKIKLAI